MPYSAQSLADVLTKTIYPALIAFVFALISLLTLWFWGVEDVDPGEPPVVRSRIPFIGHMIGLLRHHNNYFTTLRCVGYPRSYIELRAYLLPANVILEQFILSKYSRPESTSFNRPSSRKLLSVKAKKLTSIPSRHGAVEL
jgi:hypothetical protein